MSRVNAPVSYHRVPRVAPVKPYAPRTHVNVSTGVPGRRIGGVR